MLCDIAVKARDERKKQMTKKKIGTEWHTIRNQGPLTMTIQRDYKGKTCKLIRSGLGSYLGDLFENNSPEQSINRRRECRERLK